MEWHVFMDDVKKAHGWRAIEGKRPIAKGELGLVRDPGREVMKPTEKQWLTREGKIVGYTCVSSTHMKNK